MNIRTLIGEATAYDKNNNLKSSGRRVGSKVFLPLPMAKVELWFSVLAMMTKWLDLLMPKVMPRE